MSDDAQQAILREASGGLPIQRPFFVGPVEGLTPVIDHLANMLTYARATTVPAVEGLTTEQLDHLLAPDVNAIGMLLAHIACIEDAFQADTFGWEPSAEERTTNDVGRELGAPARDRIRGRDLPSYRQRLAAVRRRTVRELRHRTDDWLFEQGVGFGDQPMNTYFKWFHVAEDELNHRGQIRILRKRLPG